MNRFASRTTFVNNLILQGSNDNFATSTTIYTVDGNIHEGWNYIKFDSGSEPKFNSVRFFGSVAGSCNVGEVQFNGVVVNDDSSSTYICTP